MFLLAALLAGMIAAAMDSKIKHIIKKNIIEGTISTYRGTDTEKPGGV